MIDPKKRCAKARTEHGPTLRRRQLLSTSKPLRALNCVVWMCSFESFFSYKPREVPTELRSTWHGHGTYHRPYVIPRGSSLKIFILDLYSLKLRYDLLQKLKCAIPPNFPSAMLVSEVFEFMRWLSGKKHVGHAALKKGERREGRARVF